MRCAYKPTQDGFTLVEISIVMIIIGLLIGGTFGGMKLIENMQVNKTVQDLKGIESASLTFKDTYGRLPGDMPNTAARLPSCTVAPCATGGNGNKVIGTLNLFGGAIANTDENFTFWSHLQASDLMSLGTKNTTDMNFGEGQPSGPLSGYRISNYNVPWVSTDVIQGTIIFANNMPSIAMTGGGASMEWAISCESIESIDRKIDDNIPYNGRLRGWACTPAPVADIPYDVSRIGAIVYDLKGF